MERALAESLEEGETEKPLFRLRQMLNYDELTVTWMTGVIPPHVLILLPCNVFVDKADCCCHPQYTVKAPAAGLLD